MSAKQSAGEIFAVKDGTGQLPIPSAWRPLFGKIVDAFVEHDYKLNSDISGVRPLSAAAAAQVEDYIRDYGVTLVALPDEAWSSSVCIWAGCHWDVLVDLWTAEEGASDLVLSARVIEAEPGFSVQVQLVYVP